jgi:molybdenum cofactor biosynthesis protein B
MSQVIGSVAERTTIKKAGVSVAVAVLTVSDTRTIETDTSGKAIIDRLTQAGHRIADRKMCKDDVQTIRETIAAWVADPTVEFVIVTGGTGVTQRDVTPDAVRSLFTKPIPGFGELFRWLSYHEIGIFTIQSRADAGVCGDTIVFLLPGARAPVDWGWSRSSSRNSTSITDPATWPNCCRGSSRNIARVRLNRIGMPISDLHDGRASIDWTLPQLKSLYRTLFTQLRAEPGADLDESDCLIELQVFLQRKAQQDGVDVTHHAAWEARLGNEVPVPCEQRYARYRSYGDGHDRQRDTQ